MQPVQDANVKAVEGARSLSTYWFIAIVAIALSVAALSAGIARSDRIAEFAGSAFLILGIGVLYAAIRDTLRLLAYGDVKLLLEHPAPAIAGRFVGTIAAAAPALAGRTLQAALVCTRFDHSGANRNTKQTELWRDRRDFPLHSAAVGAVARLSFDLPPDRPPSEDRPPEGFLPAFEYSYCKWSLEVKVPMPRVDLVRTYPVIVGPAQAHARVPAPSPAVAAPESVLQQASFDDAGSDEPAGDTGSVWVLVAANAVPLFGVALWGWRVHDIVFLYWMENVVIGLFNLLRMLFAAPAGPDHSPALAAPLTAKLGLMGFFCLHYGMFCFVHGQLLAGMFPASGQRGLDLFSAVHAALHETGMLLALGAITASRAYSFVRNYLGRGEYKGIELQKLMMQPYKRIMVTHTFIIVGGFLLVSGRAQWLALLLFIGLKIGCDAYFHRRERASLRA